MEFPLHILKHLNGSLGFDFQNYYITITLSFLDNQAKFEDETDEHVQKL